MKRTKKLLALLLSAALLLTLLAACDSGSKPGPNNGDSTVISVANSPDGVTNDENRTPLGEAGGFTFDFETLEYSFTGADNAEFYYIRVFPVVDGKEANSASFQSDKIDADSSNSYSCGGLRRRVQLLRHPGQRLLRHAGQSHPLRHLEHRQFRRLPRYAGRE